MIKLYDGGAYLLHGTEIIADTPDGKVHGGVTKEEARRQTIAYGILEEHNTSGNMEQHKGKTRGCQPEGLRHPSIII